MARSDLRLVEPLVAPVSDIEEDAARLKLSAVNLLVESLDLSLQIYGFPHHKTVAIMHQLRDVVGPYKHP